MRRTWSVDLDDGRHTVEYRRPWWAHRGVILVDGAAAAETAEPWVRLGVDHPFAVAGHQGVIHVRMGAATLSVDGRSADTGLPVNVAAPLPLGLFALAIGVVVLPISIGSRLGWGLATIPAGLIAGAGGGLVTAIWTRASWSRGRRLSLGAATAIGTAVLSIVVGIGITRLTPIPSERPFAEWARFDVPGGGFSLAFPSTPSEATTQQSSGSLTMSIHTFVWEDKSAAFGAVFIDYSAEIADPATALASAVEGIVASNGGTLLEDRPVAVGGSAGRALVLAVPKSADRPPYELHARVFLRERRYYAITALAKVASGATGNVDQFLDSFVLD